MSRCNSYALDFPLQCLLYDISMARELTSLVSVANKAKVSPDDYASRNQAFSAFWTRETQKLEDMCRQHDRMPNIFFTVAPAEWKFPLHDGVFGNFVDAGRLSDVQSLLTMHVYHCMAELISTTLLGKSANPQKTGIEETSDYSMRFEFQDRGTLHVHVVAWVKFHESVGDGSTLFGRSGTANDSRLVDYLEKLFCSSVDVQCAQGEHCLLQYLRPHSSPCDTILGTFEELVAVLDMF